MSADAPADEVVSGTTGTTSEHGRRTNRYAAVACEHCQRAKTKCNGEQPCQACVAKNIECVLDRAKDGRRGRKRTLDQLNTKADALDTLLSSIKSSNDHHIQDLIHLIRDEASVDELVQYTKLVLRENETRDTARARIRRTVMDIASLIDEPPIQVPAKPWTDVTNDDSAVSHLISIYFTWQQYGYPSLDQDLFVREMKSQSLSSSFCSPFLVNCMLTAACVYTDHPSAFADPGDRSTRGLHFFNESARLWELEQEHITLVNLQALPAIITGAMALGRDRAGLLYTSRSLTFTMDLVLEVKKGLKRGNAVFGTAEFGRSYALAQWAAFLVQTEVAIAWAKPFAIQTPSKKLPYTEEELKTTRIWAPYPKRSPEISYYPFSLMNERIKLYQIAYELLPLIVSGDPHDSPLPGHIVFDHDTKLDLLHQIEQKLLGWRQNLTSESQLEYTDVSTPSEPHIDIHLAYYGFRISTASLILRMTGITQQERDEATEWVISACQSIARIFDWRLRTVGLLHFGILTPHSSSLAVYGLLEYVDRPGIPDIFHTVMVGLSAAAHRWTIARGIVKMILIELEQRKTDHLVNEETLKIMKICAVQDWTSEDTRIIEKIAYPNYAAVKERGNALSEMGELLEEYSRLQLSEKDEDLTEA